MRILLVLLFSLQAWGTLGAQSSTDANDPSNDPKNSKYLVVTWHELLDKGPNRIALIVWNVSDVDLLVRNCHGPNSARIIVTYEGSDKQTHAEHQGLVPGLETGGFMGLHPTQFDPMKGPVLHGDSLWIEMDLDLPEGAKIKSVEVGIVFYLTSELKLVSTLQDFSKIARCWRERAIHRDYAPMVEHRPP